MSLSKEKTNQAVPLLLACVLAIVGMMGPARMARAATPGEIRDQCVDKCQHACSDAQGNEGLAGEVCRDGWVERCQRGCAGAYNQEGRPNDNDGPSLFHPLGDVFKTVYPPANWLDLADQ